jgi:hypothetical protein
VLTVVAKGLDQAIRNVGNLKKQVAFANTLALTNTAKIVHAGLVEEMKTAFDRPTPYVLRGLAWLSAKKGGRDAKVFAREFAGKGTPAEYILNPQVYGGNRRIKRFEKALQGKGLMPAGWVTVPGPGARLDAFGNVSRGQLVQILSALKAFSEVGYLANRTNSRRSRKKKAGSNYFIPKQKPGAPPIGVYQHLGGRRNIPVILFKPAAHYAPIFKFKEKGREIAERAFEAEFAKAFKYATATAK